MGVSTTWRYPKKSLVYQGKSNDKWVIFLGYPDISGKPRCRFSGAWSTPRREDLRLRAAMGKRASIRGDTREEILKVDLDHLDLGFTIRVYWFRVFLEILIIMLRLIRILDVKGNQCRFSKRRQGTNFVELWSAPISSWSQLVMRNLLSSCQLLASWWRVW